MSTYIAAAAILGLSYLSASYHKKNGYYFWRTFVLAAIGFTGLFLIIYQMFL